MVTYSYCDKMEPRAERGEQGKHFRVKAKAPVRTLTARKNKESEQPKEMEEVETKITWVHMECSREGGVKLNFDDFLSLIDWGGGMKQEAYNRNYFY